MKLRKIGLILVLIFLVSFIFAGSSLEVNSTVEINDATAIGEEVYENVRRSGIGFNVNFILWPITSAEDLSFKTLKHLQLPSTNPYCIEVKGGKVSIKIDKSFDEALPRVS